MNEQYLDEIRDVLREMRAVRPNGPGQSQCIERLEQMAWARELAVLRLMWPSCPELVERYLDAVTSLLHEFPETSGTRGNAPRSRRLPRRRAARNAGRAR